MSIGMVLDCVSVMNPITILFGLCGLFCFFVIILPVQGKWLQK